MTSRIGPTAEFDNASSLDTSVATLQALQARATLVCELP